MPVITKAAEIISDSFRQYPSNIPGKYDIKGTTKNSHIVHCTHTLEITDVKLQKVYHGK